MDSIVFAVLNTSEGQKLLARREPGEQQSTGDMVLIEGPVVEVPDKIEDKNTNSLTVKAMLDRLAGLTNLAFEPSTESAVKAGPSFRDLMAFTFRPQNIVGKPNVMFFKADTTEHREKLKTIFPYVLGAVTANLLQARYDLDRLLRLLRRKENKLRALTAEGPEWKDQDIEAVRKVFALPGKKSSRRRSAPSGHCPRPC